MDTIKILNTRSNAKIQKNILLYVAHLKSIENNCTTLELYESMTNITRRGKTENNTKIFGCSTKSHKDYQRKRSYSIPFGEYSVSFDNSTIYINYYKLDEGIVELSNGFDFVTELKLSISKNSTLSTENTVSNYEILDSFI